MIREMICEIEKGESGNEVGSHFAVESDSDVGAETEVVSLKREPQDRSARSKQNYQKKQKTEQRGTERSTLVAPLKKDRCSLQPISTFDQRSGRLRVARYAGTVFAPENITKERS